jgi:hypothetical protein
VAAVLDGAVAPSADDDVPDEAAAALADPVAAAAPAATSEAAVGGGEPEASPLPLELVGGAADATVVVVDWSVAGEELASVAAGAVEVLAGLAPDEPDDPDCVL